MTVLSRARVGIEDVVAVARGDKVAIARAAESTILQSRSVVDRVITEGAPVYGLNTELGAGRNILLDPAGIEAFQRRTIRNSDGGVGEPLPDEQVRAILFTRLVGFTRGGSGVRLELAEHYRELLNRAVAPVVPRTGSVGASDLTHLAAIAAVAIGSGTAFVDGSRVPGAEALAAAGLEPIVLQAHEGLAAISANAYSVGVGALLLHELRAVADAADAAVALSLRALAGHSDGGNPSPFSQEIQAAHPSAGQSLSAAGIRSLFGENEAASVQDPVSFRAAPQVNGALRDAFARAESSVELELNSRTDNPLVDIESGRMISGGNFQAVGLALSLETVRIALGHVAATSERRLARLSSVSVGLRRAGRLQMPGLSWYSAAAIVAEIRQLANPISLSGTSLSEEVEDHSSNAAAAVQLLERSVALTRTVLAIEAVTAAELVTLGSTQDAGALEPLVAELASVLSLPDSTADRVAQAERILLGRVR
ncbi:MAG: hutH [Microbacteriaceae bacterium]|nr:hutH [Microbacteriaceae bacterium]